MASSFFLDLAYTIIDMDNELPSTTRQREHFNYFISETASAFVVWERTGIEISEENVCGWVDTLDPKIVRIHNFYKECEAVLEGVDERPLDISVVRDVLEQLCLTFLAFPNDDILEMVGRVFEEFPTMGISTKLEAALLTLGYERLSTAQRVIQYLVKGGVVLSDNLRRKYRDFDDSADTKPACSKKTDLI